MSASMSAHWGPSHASATLAAQWLAQGVPAVVVEVLASRGSVPRGDGTRLLVSAQAVAGTVGGGHLEWQAIAKARALLNHAASPPAMPCDWPLALGPSLGQCCGGALTLRFAPLNAEALARWPADPCRFRLQLHGAGHVGRAIVEVLAQVPCQVLWVDEREDAFPSHPLPAHVQAHVQALAVDAPEAEVAQARPGDFFLVLTHSHELDLRLSEAILRRADFGWFGLIGSASKRARFEHRLRDRCIQNEVLQRMCCPIGLPGLPGKEPGVIAVSVVAQMLQVSAQMAAE